MRYRLEDIFDLQMGKTPSRNNLDYWNTKDHKWISIGDLSKCERYISDTKEYISDKAVAESGISEIPANTVIMSFKLSIGKVAITPEPMYSNEAIMSFRDKHVVEIIPSYIYYMFLNKNWEFGTNKAVMGKTLNKSTLSKVAVDICDIGKQYEIVRVLDKAASIISKRKLELGKLDEMVNARFVEMFGDPVYNPKGWPMSRLEDVCTSIVDCPHSTPHYTDVNTGYICIRTSVVKKNKILWDKVEYIPEEEYEYRIQRKRPSLNDVVYTREGAILGIAAVIDRGCNIALGQRMMLLTPNINKCNPIFLSTVMNIESFFYKAIQGVSGSASPHINVGDIKNFSIIIPPIQQQNQFVDFVNQIDKSKSAIQKSLDETQTLFNSLMQEYFG